MILWFHKSWRNEAVCCPVYNNPPPLNHSPEQQYISLSISFHQEQLSEAIRALPEQPPGTSVVAISSTRICSPFPVHLLINMFLLRLAGFLLVFILNSFLCATVSKALLKIRRTEIEFCCQVVVTFLSHSTFIPAAASFKIQQVHNIMLFIARVFH